MSVKFSWHETASTEIVVNRGVYGSILVYFEENGWTWKTTSNIGGYTPHPLPQRSNIRGIESQPPLKTIEEAMSEAEKYIKEWADEKFSR